MYCPKQCHSFCRFWWSHRQMDVCKQGLFEDIFVSTNTIDDTDVVDDDNVEWVCINKDWNYHNHIVDIDDEDGKSMSNNFGDFFVIKKWCQTTLLDYY